MAKRGKNSNYKQTPTFVGAESDLQYQKKSGPRRTVVAAVRWSAWIVLISVILTQLTGEMVEDSVALGMFIIAALLYGISVVLERKYHW